MKALVIDDDDGIRRFLRIGLKIEGYDVVEAVDAAEGLRLLGARRPELVILDLGLPDLDGQELVPAIRGVSQALLIVLSVRDSQAEKIRALDNGADDYLTKPFDFGELAARIRAFRRKAWRSDERGRLVAGQLTLDPADHGVRLGESRLELTPKEFELLRLLMQHRDKLVAHRECLDQIWGPGHAHDTAYLRVYIQRLRKKLTDAGDHPGRIVSQPGVGYRLASQPQG
ncbi:response regulator transcription factor [Salinisphaera sp. T31B1]|uniref:response regulator transcription factor n=1 Tax=Salinisphaera sp. T31B1 TaxID=727963 RepID=UPI00334264D5